MGYGARMEKTGAASDWEARDRVVSLQAKDLTEEAKYGMMKIIKRKESRSIYYASRCIGPDMHEKMRDAPYKSGFVAVRYFGYCGRETSVG